MTQKACLEIQISNLVHRMEAEELAPRVPVDLLPGLTRCMEHTRVDVRKAAVFAVAELWHKLGDERWVILFLMGDVYSVCKVC